MSSWIPILMLVLAGFFAGGVYSTVRAKNWVFAVGLTIAVVLCLVASALWWQ